MATKNDPLGLKKFNAADYINDAEDAHYFLAAALEHGDLAHLIKAVGTVSRALGVAKIAKTVQRFHDTQGYWWVPAKLLLDLAASGRKFNAE